jgi:hypothetical protein
MTVKTRIDPKTGKMETYGYADDPADLAKQIAKDRKVLRDMLDGNIQFHEDKNTPPKPPEPQADTVNPGWYGGNYEDWVGACLADKREQDVGRDQHWQYYDTIVVATESL